MGLDLIFLVLLAWYGYKGYRKGLVHVVFSGLAMIVATLGALKLSGKVSAYLFDKNTELSPWVPMLSFLIVFCALIFFVFLVSRTVDSSLRRVRLGGLNRIAGMVLYGFLVCFFFSTILWLGDKVNLLNPDTKASSMSYPYIAPIASWGFDTVGEILPFVKNSYAELEAIFDHVDQKML